MCLFLGPDASPRWDTWKCLAFRLKTKKKPKKNNKRASHLLNQFMSTNYWYCAKEVKILLIIPLSSKHLSWLNHHSDHKSPGDTAAQWQRWMFESLWAGNNASGADCGALLECGTMSIKWWGQLNCSSPGPAFCWVCQKLRRPHQLQRKPSPAY